MTKNDVIKYIIENNLNIAKEQVMISLLIALLLGLFVYFIYRVTYTGTVYSKEFGQSLVYITVITTMIMTIIQSNLALSLGMVGSLSIIRFRTAIKSQRDISFVFWGIAVGVACGAALFLPGILGSVIVGSLAFVFYKVENERTVYLLTISVNSGGGANGY